VTTPNSPNPSSNAVSRADIEQAQLTRRRWIWGISALVVIILATLIEGLVEDFLTKHNGSHQGLPVVLAVAKSSNVPVYLQALGTVTPTSSVTVKTQINGQLMQVLYHEGQDVRTGELLAQIDPRPYQAQLIQYQGQLARDQALLLNDQLNLKRYQLLWKQDSVAKQTMDTQAAQVAQDEGTVKIDQGLVQNTQLNLTYTRITSPIDGRVGLRLVDPGNYVQTSDTTGIAVINTLDPITVIFTIPEDNVPEVVDQINAGKPLTVEAYDRQQNRLLATGTLITIDNQIDPTTGTVKLRAQFPNKKNLLFPNQFVNINLLIDTLVNATVVPTAAIQPSTQSPYVFLYNKDNTVSIKQVKTGVTADNDMTVVTGIAPEQSVVVEGADKLTDGASVTVADPTQPAAATAKKHAGGKHNK